MNGSHLVTDLAAGPTIADVLPSVAAQVGVPGFTDVLGLPDAPRYVVLVIDGLGEMQLREHAELAPFLSSLASRSDVFSTIPSTTASSLTSFGTGLPVGQHGVVGYTSRVPGTLDRINSLKWDRDVEPEIWQPHPSVLGRCSAHGVAVAMVSDSRFARSGLTQCSQRHVPYLGVGSVWERYDVVLDTVDEHDRVIVHTYESRLDHAGHGHGVDSDTWRENLTAIDREVADLRAELPADAVLIVTADHGMIDLPAHDRFDVDDHPRLLDDVTLLAGELRMRYLHTAPDSAPEVAARWQSTLGDGAVVRLRDEGVEDWFGPIAPEVLPRIGDVIVASTGTSGVFSSREFPVELGMVGVHGSITEAERRIPVLVAD